MTARLAEVEHRNVVRYGYGIKSYTLSMLEAAIEATGDVHVLDSFRQVPAWLAQLR